MCFDLDSQPPVQPILGSDAHGELLTLTAADGATFAAYHAHADSARTQGAAIVILPDVRGLYQFYKDLALRYAESGVEAIAIDYFGRTAGLTARDDAFEYMPHVERTTADQIRQDVAAAIAQLRSGANPPRAIFTVGFCFGGANSYNQAANHLGLAGVIGYYGRAMSPGRDGSPSPAERVGEMEGAVLGFFGGADQGIPVEQAKAFDAALAKAGIEREIIIYPGAPHSFFDRKFKEFATESEDSWTRSLAFIQAHTPQP
ncbi:MAG: dienelactone hydrolase family protein [Chloroflexota bacterium]|nr:dienelactone hydrolase family protein [Chloroflexota bacterium]